MLYFFLAAVSDKDGLSFYSDASIAVRLRITEAAVVVARGELVAEDLVAYRAPLVQVLSLPSATVERRDGGLVHFGEMLRANATEVRILDQGVEVARHPRCYEKRRLLIQSDLRLAALKLRRRRHADQRVEEFDALGPEAREFHLKLLSMPVKPTVHLRRLLGLVRLYGRKEVLAAIRQALQYQTYDAAYVEAILVQERRRRELPSPIATIA